MGVALLLLSMRVFDTSPAELADDPNAHDDDTLLATLAALQTDMCFDEALRFVRDDRC